MGRLLGALAKEVPFSCLGRERNKWVPQLTFKLTFKSGPQHIQSEIHIFLMIHSYFFFLWFHIWGSPSQHQSLAQSLKSGAMDGKSKFESCGSGLCLCLNERFQMFIRCSSVHLLCELMILTCCESMLLFQIYVDLNLYPKETCVPSDSWGFLEKPLCSGICVCLESYVHSTWFRKRVKTKNNHLSTLMHFSWPSKMMSVLNGEIDNYYISTEHRIVCLWLGKTQCTG